MTRYAVRRSDGSWVGGKRYSYRHGTENSASSQEAARIFSRQSDAARMAIQEGGRVVPVTITFPEGPE